MSLLKHWKNPTILHLPRPRMAWFLFISPFFLLPMAMVGMIYRSEGLWGAIIIGPLWSMNMACMVFLSGPWPLAAFYLIFYFLLCRLILKIKFDALFHVAFFFTYLGITIAPSVAFGFAFLDHEDDVFYWNAATPIISAILVAVMAGVLQLVIVLRKRKIVPDNQSKE